MYNSQKKGSFPVPMRSRTPAKRKNDGNEPPFIFSALKCSAVASGIALTSGLVLVTLATAIAYVNPDPTPLIFPLGLLALMASMFAGGFVCAKLLGSSPLLCGILSGAMTTLITILISAIARGIPSSAHGFWEAALLHGAAIGFSILGAFAGNLKRRGKKFKKRFNR